MFSDRLARGDIVVIDGGLSTALEEMGHDLSDDLWSARLLRDDPEAIVEAHRRYVEAGAEIVISSSYQASIPGFMASGLSKQQAKMLITSSTELARRGVDGKALVAASVGPYGAYLSDGSEYTGEYGLTLSELLNWHAERFELLVSTKPDLLAIETIPCLTEVGALAPLLEASKVEAWVSFSCAEGGRMNSGEDVADAARAVEGIPNLMAIGVNCTSSENVGAALERIRTVSNLPLVVYPNLGRTWDGEARIWVGPSRDWFDYLPEWFGLGVRVIGGCCGTRPADIARLRSLV